jgi:outer membrane lipoprotein-sorting protein
VHSVNSRMRVTAALFCFAATVSQAAETLPDILARLDQSAAAFKGMTSSMKRLDHTAVINDTSEERGTVSLRKTNKGVQVLMDVTYPDKNIKMFTGKQFQVYLPKINTIQIYNVGGRRRDQVDQFLVIGFGTSGKELQSAYNIKLGGPETVNGIKATRIELVPKSRDALELFQRLDLWIPEGGNHAIQQKVHLKGGDYKLLTYSDIKLNPSLTDSSFDLKAPKDAKKEYIGK